MLRHLASSKRVTLCRSVIPNIVPPLARGHGGHGDGTPGKFAERDSVLNRDLTTRAFTVGIGGPVGSGKTALVKQLCLALREELSIGVVTNDIFTREDAEFLTKHDVLPKERITAVETGGCPHAAIREDISGNMAALRHSLHLILALAFTLTLILAIILTPNPNWRRGFSRQVYNRHHPCCSARCT